MPLPWVDVRWLRSSLVVIVGGFDERYGGAAEVSTTTVTIVVIPVAVATVMDTIAMVIVPLPVVVVVGLVGTVGTVPDAGRARRRGGRDFEADDTLLE